MSLPAAEEAGMAETQGLSAGSPALRLARGWGPAHGHSPLTAAGRSDTGDNGRAAEQCLHSPKRRLEGFLCFKREGLGPSKYTL